MNNPLEIAKSTLLEPAGINEAILSNLFSKLMTRSIDMSDMYFQFTQQESWALEDGIIKEGSFNIEKGAGIRAVTGEKTGFAYTDDITLAALEEAATAAGNIAKIGGEGKVKVWTPTQGRELYSPLNPLNTWTENDKINLLKKVDAEARRIDARVKQVIVSLAGLHDIILIADSDGRLSADVRPLVRFNVSVIVEEGGKREQGFAGGGGRHGYDNFFDNDYALKFAHEAVRQALVNLNAVPAPAGTMPVVLGPGWPGVLLHEAVGHGLEGDFNRKGSSIFAGKMGERVASDVCTVVDDGTLPQRRGSLNIDDEGVPSSCTVLIEKGVLKGYMQDKLNAKLMGMQSTGNGRRESYSSLPIPRMTNTYMLAGEHSPQEIIASVEHGLFAVNFGGGQVDITSGKFVFSTSEAYIIKNGKIAHPVKGATLIGNGAEVLTRVSMVGNDLELDRGVGTCGKDGQSVPVGVGQPTLRVDALTVGGTQS
ncbi:MAG: metalloprotease TldD [Gammaproteobacteria bacterium]|nr:metalloprotease TldD [Gammaproteobacteria bacterium]